MSEIFVYIVRMQCVCTWQICTSDILENYYIVPHVLIVNIVILYKVKCSLVPQPICTAIAFIDH